MGYEEAAAQTRALSLPPTEAEGKEQGGDEMQQDGGEEEAGVELSPEDYVLGVYDMTGELMRFAITTMATSGKLPAPVGAAGEEEERNILIDLRSLRALLEGLEPGHGPFAKDAEKKMEVMRQSVEKVEKALYGLVVRGAERPPGWMPDTSEGGAQAVGVEG